CMVMKEGYTKEVDEKKTELQTKVVEVYEASATEIKESIGSQKADTKHDHIPKHDRNLKLVELLG
ncbi:plasma membrane-associated cation-binding protein 1-like protein isoform X1, partial [Tanacetum coccineum]